MQQIPPPPLEQKFSKTYQNGPISPREALVLLYRRSIMLEHLGKRLLKEVVSWSLAAHHRFHDLLKDQFLETAKALPKARLNILNIFKEHTYSRVKIVKALRGG
jgi:hypothetical protein